MINIIIIVGESGCGKSTLEKELVERLDYKRIKSTTSRPIRSSETGNEYSFIDEDKFKQMIVDDKFVEHARYNGWYYGLPVDELSNKSIAVLTPHGLRQLRTYLKRHNLEKGISLSTIYLKVDRKSRLIKLIQTRDDIEECYRRNLSDIGMYTGIEDEMDIVLDNSEYRLSSDVLAERVIQELKKTGELND